MAPKKSISRKSSMGNSSSREPFDSTRFQIISDFQKFDSLIKYRSIWSESVVVFDELSPTIRQNFESRGWLSISSNLVPSPAAIIREFYSNLAVRAAVTGSEYHITCQDVSVALSIPIAANPVYPYSDPPSLDDVVFVLCGAPMVWDDEPRLDTSELTEDNFFFYRIACHSVLLVFHSDTIPTDRLFFLYGLVTSASMCLPSLFIQTIVDIHRNTTCKQNLFFLVSILRILEHLGFECPSSSKLFNQISPIEQLF